MSFNRNTNRKPDAFEQQTETLHWRAKKIDSAASSIRHKYLDFWTMLEGILWVLEDIPCVDPNSSLFLRLKLSTRIKFMLDEIDRIMSEEEKDAAEDFDTMLRNTSPKVEEEQFEPSYGSTLKGFLRHIA
ncbi:hypothetical protein Tco_0681405, partial [Tanacetum coccineum]